MAINRLDHASLLTPDLDKALAWYVDILGMTVLEKTADHVHLSCASAVADLTLVTGGIGIRDFTFGVDDEEDLDRVAGILAVENILHERTTGGSRPGEGSTLAFTTPSGHLMRLATGNWRQASRRDNQLRFERFTFSVRHRSREHHWRN